MAAAFSTSLKKPLKTRTVTPQEVDFQIGIELENKRQRMLNKIKEEALLPEMKSGVRRCGGKTNSVRIRNPVRKTKSLAKKGAINPSPSKRTNQIKLRARGENGRVIGKQNYPKIVHKIGMDSDELVSASEKIVEKLPVPSISSEGESKLQVLSQSSLSSKNRRKSSTPRKRATIVRGNEDNIPLIRDSCSNVRDQDNTTPQFPISSAIKEHNLQCQKPSGNIFQSFTKNSEKVKPYIPVDDEQYLLLHLSTDEEAEIDKSVMQHSPKQLQSSLIKTGFDIKVAQKIEKSLQMEDGELEDSTTSGDVSEHTSPKENHKHQSTVKNSRTPDKKRKHNERSKGRDSYQSDKSRHHKSERYRHSGSPTKRRSNDIRDKKYSVGSDSNKDRHSEKRRIKHDILENKVEHKYSDNKISSTDSGGEKGCNSVKYKDSGNTKPYNLLAKVVKNEIVLKKNERAKDQDIVSLNIKQINNTKSDQFVTTKSRIIENKSDLNKEKNMEKHDSEKHIMHNKSAEYIENKAKEQHPEIKNEKKRNHAEKDVTKYDNRLGKASEQIETMDDRVKKSLVENPPSSHSAKQTAKDTESAVVVNNESEASNTDHENINVGVANKNRNIENITKCIDPSIGNEHINVANSESIATSSDESDDDDDRFELSFADTNTVICYIEQPNFKKSDNCVKPNDNFSLDNLKIEPYLQDGKPMNVLRVSPLYSLLDIEPCVPTNKSEPCKQLNKEMKNLPSKKVQTPLSILYNEIPELVNVAMTEKPLFFSTPMSNLYEKSPPGKYKKRKPVPNLVHKKLGANSPTSKDAKECNKFKIDNSQPITKFFKETDNIIERKGKPLEHDGTVSKCGIDSDKIEKNSANQNKKRKASNEVSNITSDLKKSKLSNDTPVALNDLNTKACNPQELLKNVDVDQFLSVLHGPKND